jgi:hypothetical protein
MQHLLGVGSAHNIKEFGTQKLLELQAFNNDLISPTTYLPSLQPRLAQASYNVIHDGLILVGKSLCKVLQRKFGVYP